jgi:hypothetical protein|tara:strand:+ start:1385 stop:1612 length:228 start_codon:yes stop_codon:yes gene_type:complete
MKKEEIYKTILMDGSSVECNRLSLCCLNDYYPKLKKVKYQVDCDDYRFKFSQLYETHELDKAVQKYVELKGKLYK